MLGENQFSLSGPIFFVVHFWPIQECHDICILLQIARISQIRQGGDFDVSRFNGPIDLRQGDHRDIEFTG